MADNKSTTWSHHVRLICQKYGLPNPLALLQGPAMPKPVWKTLVQSKITTYHEKNLRQKAENNYKLRYLNVSVLGLSGRPHPAILNIHTTRDAMKLRSHIKFLSGDFLSYEVLAKERGGTPKCRLCPSACESTQHILTECGGTIDTRQRLYPELLNLLATVHPSNTLQIH